MKSIKTFKSIKIAPVAPTITESPKVVASSSLASVFAAEETQKLIAEQVAILNAPTKEWFVKLFNESAGGKGYKVWSAWRDGYDIVTEWGAEHATKQESRKTYWSETEARRALRVLVESKRKKGYRETK